MRALRGAEGDRFGSNTVEVEVPSTALRSARDDTGKNNLGVDRLT